MLPPDVLLKASSVSCELLHSAGEDNMPSGQVVYDGLGDILDTPTQVHRSACIVVVSLSACDLVPMASMQPHAHTSAHALQCMNK